MCRLRSGQQGVLVGDGVRKAERADLGVGARAGDDAAFDGEGGAVAAGVALDDCDFAVGRDERREGQGEGEDDVGEHLGEMGGAF